MFLLADCREVTGCLLTPQTLWAIWLSGSIRQVQIIANHKTAQLGKLKKRPRKTKNDLKGKSGKAYEGFKISN